MHTFPQVLFDLFSSFICLTLGIYILYKSRTILKTFIINEWLRANIVGLLIFECFFCTIIPIFHDFQGMETQRGFWVTLLFFCLFVMVNVTPVINIILALKSSKAFQRLSFSLQQAIIFVVIVVVPILATLSLNFYNNHHSTRHFKWAFSFSIFTSALVGVGYLFYAYANYEKQQLLQSKELQLTRLNELKIKAELETLHSKINPHFLYNALNSIADLTITDGQKAREMTIALSDLFRYAINYSNSNYATVKEEVAMTETYLRIEKVRFEDNLDFSVAIQPGANEFLVPRFILQPLVENAVKHGLKGANKKGKIALDISLDSEQLFIKVFDNGESFPGDLATGYGLGSVMDKLNLLFANKYSIEFINQPVKHLLIVFKKANA